MPMKLVFVKIFLLSLGIFCNINSCLSNMVDDEKSVYAPVEVQCKAKKNDTLEFGYYSWREFKVSLAVFNSDDVYIKNIRETNDLKEWFHIIPVDLEGVNYVNFLGSESSDTLYILIMNTTEEQEQYWVGELTQYGIRSLGLWGMDMLQESNLSKKDGYWRLSSHPEIKIENGKIELYYTDEQVGRFLDFTLMDEPVELVRNPSESDWINDLEKNVKLKQFEKITLDLDYSEGVYDKETIEINWNKRLVKFKKNNATKSQNEFLHQNIYFRNDTLVISHTEKTYIADYFFTYKPEYDDVLMVKISLYLKCDALGSTMKNYKVDFFDMRKYHQSLSGLRDLDEENYLHVFQRLFSYKDFYFHFADSSGSKFSNPYGCEIYPTEMEIALMSKSLINKNNIDSFIFLFNSCYNIYKAYFKQRSNSFYLKDVLYNARIILYQINLIDDKNYKSFLLLADICWEANQKLESISAYKQYINIMKELGEQDSMPKYILERIKND